MFWVLALTAVMLSCRLVTVLAANVSVTPDPSLARAGTGMLDPSLNWMFPAVIWSLELGRSYSTIVSNVWGLDQVSSSQLPAPPPTVAHSTEELPG